MRKCTPCTGRQRPNGPCSRRASPTAVGQRRAQQRRETGRWSMNTVTVRELTPEDEAEVAEVDRLATADLRKVYRPTSLAQKQRSAIDTTLQRLVAILDGRVAGTVQYRIVAA